jgi:hypothetical protein
MLDLTLNAALLLTLIAGLAITLQKPMRLFMAPWYGDVRSLDKPVNG